MSRDPPVRSDRPVGYDPLTQQNLSAATVFMRLGATSLARLHGCVRLVFCQAKLLSLPSCLYYFLSLLVSLSFSHYQVKPLADAAELCWQGIKA